VEIAQKRNLKQVISLTGCFKMIVMITGDLGSGKTCMLTRYGCKASMVKDLCSNYHYNNVPYDKFDMVDLYVNKPDLKNFMICADELYTFMDCRTSMSKRNRLESYFVLQTRKKNVDLYFTAQYSELVDSRLIKFVSIWIKMENIWLKSKTTGLLYKHPYLFLATFHDYRKSDNINVFTRKFDGRRWFNEYNTDEVIYPPEDIEYVQEALKKKSSSKK